MSLAPVPQMGSTLVANFPSEVNEVSDGGTTLGANSDFTFSLPQLRTSIHPARLLTNQIERIDHAKVDQRAPSMPRVPGLLGKTSNYGQLHSMAPGFSTWPWPLSLRVPDGVWPREFRAGWIPLGFPAGLGTSGSSVILTVDGRWGSEMAGARDETP